MTKHSYESYEQSMLWKVLEEAIVDLSKNDDLLLQTRTEYVVGYICKKLGESKLRIME